LVEVMIVLAIMAILSAIALPNFQTYMAQKRLSGAARELYGDLASARSQAVSMNQRITLKIDNNHTYTIFKDENSDGVADSGETLSTRDIHTTYHDVVFTTSPGKVVFFYRNGTGSPESLEIENSTGSKTITISFAGRIKIS
jgi:type II secretion system protein H